MYLDNILIYSKTRKDYVRAIREVLKRLRKFALFASPKKCFWFKHKVDFLRFVVTPKGIEMDPSRVTAVSEWPTLRTYADIQQFLRFTGFYRRFIKHYSKIVKPFID